MKLRVLLVACLAVWALPSFAIPCPTTFMMPPDSDALAVCAPNGTLYDYVSVTEANEDPNAVYALTLAGPDVTQFGFATVFCEYQGICGPGLPQQYYSDVFGVATDGNGNYFLAFASDAENGSPFGGDPNFIYAAGPCGEFHGEPCGWYDATMYLDPALRAQGYTAWFISETPEPTTMLLLGTGLGLLARKLRKT